MKTQKKYWLIIFLALSVTVASLCTVILLFWNALPAEQQQRVHSLVIDYFAYFFTGTFIIFVAFGFAADWIYRAYVVPINRLAGEIEVINTINPDLRVSVRGSFDVRRLARIINKSAERIAELLNDRSGGISSANGETEGDKAILAALLSDLPQGILVCNLEGRIVFYNRKAKDLLADPEGNERGDSSNGATWVGLGRSVYRFIDKSLIQGALARLSDQVEADDSLKVERFLVSAGRCAVVPGELRPVLDSRHKRTGFIIYLEDLTAKIKAAEEESRHLLSWQHQLTQSISVIKTAAEILQDESFQSDGQYHQMIGILGEQSELAARLWTKKEIAGKWSEKPLWTLTPMPARKWAESVVDQVAPELRLDLTVEPEDLSARISIDIHQFTHSVTSILDKARRQCQIKNASVRLYNRDAWLYMDVLWKGQSVGEDLMKKWKAEPFESGNDHPALAMGEVLSYHGAKLWPLRTAAQPDNSGLRLLVPTMEEIAPEALNGRLTILPDARPEFYDFDLFQQAGQSPEMEKRMLSELTYTVFDTETTGLDPAGGDEIISIGAMRIVNGRLLQEEIFDQLIDPKRHLPWESVKYHGIRPEMLVDQPTIEKVLPRFQRFVRDTVLVGHNVAFDMRMLQIKEAITDIKFINPVLDTMLLSSLINPAHESHSLSRVAERIGVKVHGRHTAVGDAAATGEIFLKLLPLLAQKGINTLGDAIEASKTSYYARLKY